MLNFSLTTLCFFSVVNDPQISANDLNHDLELINKWAYQWKMSFNPDPTKQATEILFSCKKTKVDHPDLYFNGNIVSRVSEHKHLGLILTPKLNFENHLHEKIKKAKKNVGIIKCLNKFLPLKTLEQMYKSLVRPLLEYCDIIYHEPPIIHTPPLGVTLPTHMKKIESVQYQAALAVTGAWKGSDRVKLYEELGWESLSDRRMCRRVLQIHKIVDRKTPPYLRDKLPPNRNVLINLPNIFHEVRCRTGRFSSSFFPNAITSWNNIVSHFQHLPTFEGLKDHILSLIRPVRKAVFGIHDPMHIRHIFQLRVGLSHLRSHKKHHNFVDTPTDKCLCKQGVEDTRHFLLHCPFYAIHREKLFKSTNTILNKHSINMVNDYTRLLLYGHSDLNAVDNRSILMATIEFIKNTNRFRT